MIQKNKKVAEEIADMINDMAFDYKGVAEQMALQHRTLQDNFTHLCVEWLTLCSTKDYRYDERNYFSHYIGEKFNEFMNPKTVEYNCSDWMEINNQGQICGYTANRLTNDGATYIYYTILGDEEIGYTAKATNTIDNAERIAVRDTTTKSPSIYRDLNKLKEDIENGNQLWLYVGRCNTGEYTKTTKA